MIILKGNPIGNNEKNIHKIMKDFNLENDYEYDVQEKILTILKAMSVQDFIYLKKAIRESYVLIRDLRICAYGKKDK